MKTRTSFVRLSLVLALALAPLSLPPLRAESPAALAAASRHWTLSLAGQTVGSFVETSGARDGGGSRTREVMRLTINRLGSKVSIETDATSDESPAGELVALEVSAALGSEPVKTRVLRDGQNLRLTTEAGGKSYDKSIPVSERLLGPAGVRRLSREKLQAVGDAISFHQFSPESGAVAQLRRTVTGVLAEGLQVEEEVVGVPGKSKVLLTRDGQWLRRAQMLPFGELLIVPATAEAARLAEAGGTLPEDSYDRTMARSNIRLPDPRSISRLTLQLRHRAPELGWPDFHLPGQTVRPVDATTWTVEVRRAERGEAAPPPGPDFRRANSLLQSDDAEVQRLAREITAGIRGDLAKARALHDWVNRNMSLDLGVALASAAEVARNRRGTCIASAVLLAALQRAAGLPSRVALGLVYYCGIWGGHAWTDVYIDGRWLSLDAAMYAPGAADAARLRFGSSSGEDRLEVLQSAGLKMFGNVDIRVLEFEVRGRAVQVPEKAAPQVVGGASYTNRWLGFRLTAPDGYRIGGLDSVFPDPTVVAVEDSAGTRVRIGQSIAGADAAARVTKFLQGTGEGARTTALKLGGRPARAAIGKDRARLILHRGTEEWTLAAEGPAAATALQATAAAWRWQ